MNELSKQLMCVQIRSGMQIWVEHDRAKNLINKLKNEDGRFIEFDGQIFNRADIVGVFSPNTMSEHTRRKNGEWQCDKATWHKRGETCECGHTRVEFCAEHHPDPCTCETTTG